jgi:hypothetical protein
VSNRILEKVKKLLERTVENGCTESEAASAASLAQSLIDQHELSDEELSKDSSGKLGYRIQTHEIPVRYPESWRGMICLAVAKNCAVLCFRRADKQILMGREETCEAVSAIAVSIVEFIEREQSAYGRGRSTTQRRQFARGMCERVAQRILESFNLTKDARLPMIISNSKELITAESGLNLTKGRTMSRTVDEDFLRGHIRGESVPLRKSTAQLS